MDEPAKGAVRAKEQQPLNEAIADILDLGIPRAISRGCAETGRLAADSLAKAEVLESFLKFGDLTATIDQFDSAARPCRVRFWVDVELHDIALLAPC
mgnify:CR=1 FL=1